VLILITLTLLSCENNQKDGFTIKQFDSVKDDGNVNALIEISAVPYSNDIIGLQDLYIQLDTNNVTINSVNDRISSGYDISGSDYIVSSSFANGSLVRGTVDSRVTTTQTPRTSSPVTTTTQTPRTSSSATTTTTTTTPTTTTTRSTSSPTYSY